MTEFYFSVQCAHCEWSRRVAAPIGAGCANIRAALELEHANSSRNCENYMGIIGEVSDRAMIGR